MQADLGLCCPSMPEDVFAWRSHLYLSMHINTVTCPQNSISIRMLGPVVQSIVSSTSSLRVISLTVLADSIHNILLFFAEKM